MFLGYIRQAIGVQRLLAIVALAVLFFFTPHSHPGHPGALETGNPVSGLLSVIFLIGWIITLGVSGMRLLEQARPERLSSVLLLLLWIGMYWCLRGFGSVPPSNAWLPTSFDTYELGAWFCLCLTTELAVVEILLPPYGDRPRQPYRGY